MPPSQDSQRCSLQFSGGTVHFGNAQTILNLVEQHPNRRVTILRIVDIDIGQYRQAFDRLEHSRASMDQLENLSVGISYPERTNAFRLPRLRLERMRFPSLRQLSLDGAYFERGSDVISALEKLQLSNYDRSPVPTIPVRDLRQDLAMATSLRELYISRALKGIDFGNGHITLPTTTIPALQTFICEDQGNLIHDFLCHIDIQPHVQAKLTPIILADPARTHWAVEWLSARCAGESNPYALRATYENAQLMPADYEPLASLFPSLHMVPGFTAPSILGKIAAINISKYCKSKETNTDIVSFVANTQESGRGSGQVAFELELPSNSYTELFQLQNSALCLITAHIAIRRAPLTMLFVSLDLDCIDPFNWLQLFSSTPFLQSVHITDTTSFDPIAIGAIELFQALRRLTRKSANRPEGVAAPRLKMFTLDGAVYSKKLLEVIQACMVDRASSRYQEVRGGAFTLCPTILNSLTLNFAVHRHVPKEEDIMAFRRAMQTLNSNIRLAIKY
ncbi:hypothetical protein C8Q80DRAFT_386676 [Daedaleopsis nitida]|nr:hypothetical protein C8Q80DRAFT_386676 [Daedaleopsis nitida]